MYTITKTLSGAVITRHDILTVNCSEQELITKVLPKLKKLASAENLAFHRINSYSRVKFEVKPFEGVNLVDTIDHIDKAIMINVNNYNDKITEHNQIVKRSNKKNGKALFHNTKEPVKLIDYLSPFNREVGFELISDVIYIGEEDVEIPKEEKD